jgi:urease accessory protein
VDVEEAATLVALPDLVAPFRGARYEQHSVIRLAPTASLVWLDGTSCGRHAHGERWDFARYATRTTLMRAQKLVAFDHLVLDAAQGDLGRRMGRFQALATLFVLGPAMAPLVDALRVGKPSAGPRSATVANSSPIDDGLVVRFAGASVAALSEELRACLSGLPAILGDDPFARKW